MDDYPEYDWKNQNKANDALQTRIDHQEPLTNIQRQQELILRQIKAIWQSIHDLHQELLIQKQSNPLEYLYRNPEQHTLPPTTKNEKVTQP